LRNHGREDLRRSMFCRWSCYVWTRRIEPNATSQTPSKTCTKDGAIDGEHRDFWYVITPGKYAQELVNARKVTSLITLAWPDFTTETDISTLTHAHHQGQAHHQKGYRNPNITTAIPQQPENIGEAHSANRRSSSQQLNFAWSRTPPQEHENHLQDQDVRMGKCEESDMRVCYPTICKGNWGCWVKQASELRTWVG
jgi:hypothetical protein